MRAHFTLGPDSGTPHGATPPVRTRAHPHGATPPFCPDSGTSRSRRRREPGEDDDRTVAMVGKAQRFDLTRRPAIADWWLADHDPATRSHELGRHSERLRRRSETPRGHRVEPLAGLDQHTGVAAPHGHSIAEPERRHRSLEEIGAFLPSVDERHGEVRAVVGHHQPRDPSPAADVDHRRTSASGRLVRDLVGRDRRRERPDELAGVLDDFFDRTCAEESQPLRRPQRVEQVTDRAVGAAATRVQDSVTTTRRVGSSPSEWLPTPSMVASTSWMTLRSADGIGSSARAFPVSTT